MWNSRIVGHDKVDPDQLTGHPLNHRLHPERQREVVADSIRTLGFVKSVLVNKRTGYVLDGHERLWQALDAKRSQPNIKIDVEYIDVSEEDERAILALLDASSELATVDPEKFSQLIEDVTTGSQALDELLAEIAGMEPADQSEAIPHWYVKVDCENERQQQELARTLREGGYECNVGVSKK